MSQEPPVDDAALVDQVQAARRAARDDFRAFEVLVERYQDRVLGNCRYLTGSQSDAEDLAQEVFAKVFSGLAGFERRSGFKTWLWRIKVNHCLNFLQRSRRERFVAVHEPEVEQRPELQVGPAAPPESGDRVRPRGDRTVARRDVGNAARSALVARPRWVLLSGDRRRAGSVAVGRQDADQAGSRGFSKTVWRGSERHRAAR